MRARLPADPAIVEAVSMVLARQMLGAPDITLEQAWAPQRDDVKAGLRAKAVEILHAIETVRFIQDYTREEHRT